MTGDQGTLDSSLTGGYMSKASNFGPAIFKVVELVSLPIKRIVNWMDVLLLLLI